MNDKKQNVNVGTPGHIDHCVVAGQVERLVNRFICWWFGCKPDHDNAVFDTDEYSYGWCTPCMRCHETDIGYDDLVGDARHKRFKKWLNYYLYRKWWPEKCTDCGHRYKCNNSITHDHIPF